MSEGDDDDYIDEQIKQEKYREYMFQDCKTLKFYFSMIGKKMNELQGEIKHFESLIENMRLKYSDDENDKKKVQLTHDEILEGDLIRWMLLEQNKFNEILKLNIKETDFFTTYPKQIYITYFNLLKEKKANDILSICAEMDSREICSYLSNLLQRKVNMERSELHMKETIQRILDRNWMAQRENIKIKIQSGKCSDQEAMDLVSRFDELKRNPPKVTSQ